MASTRHRCPTWQIHNVHTWCVGPIRSDPIRSSQSCAQKLLVVCASFCVFTSPAYRTSTVQVPTSPQIFAGAGASTVGNSRSPLFATATVNPSSLEAGRSAPPSLLLRAAVAEVAATAASSTPAPEPCSVSLAAAVNLPISSFSSFAILATLAGRRTFCSFAVLCSCGNRFAI
jgi:hypothetical protein